MTLASLGLQVRYQDVENANRSLDGFAQKALQSQKAAETLANASIKQAAAQKTLSSATAESARQVMSAIQAEQKLENVRLQAQITDEGRRQSLNRLAQLARDSVAISHQIAAADAETARSQDAYNASLDRYAAVAVKGLQVQRQAAQMAQAGINFRIGGGNLFPAGNTGEDFEAAAAEMDAVRAKFSPLFAASKQYEGALNEINDAEARGVLLSHEAAAARENATLAFQRETSAARGVGSAYSFAGGSLANLSFQVNDIVTGLLSGQSPGTILFQQGGQVLQIWQLNRSVFREMGSSLLGLLTPARLLAGGILGVGAALAYVYAQGILAEKALEAALAGPGKAAGVTAGQLSGMATAAANASNISVGSARSIAEAYASSGHITGDHIRELTELTADYAATTHQDMSDATKNLVQDFSDLSTGIDDLAKRLGGIDPAQRAYIQNLIASGQYQKAEQAAIDAMRPTLANHLDQLTWIGRAWNDIKNFASGAITTMQDAANPSLDIQITAARARLAEAQRMGGGFYEEGGNFVTAGDAQNDLKGLLAQQQQQLDKAATDARRAASTQLGNATAPVLSGLLPGATGSNVHSELQDLINQRDQLAKLMGDQGALTANGFSAQQAAQAWEAYDHAVSSYISPAERAMKQTQLATEALSAKTPAERAAVAAAQARLDQQGKVVVAEQREAEVTAAASQARAAATYQLTIQNQEVEAAIKGSIALAAAYSQYGAAAMVAAAQSQAAIEHITTGIDVQTRTQQLLTQAVASATDQQSQQIAQQMRVAEVTKAANDNVANGSLAYDHLNDAIQEQVGMLELEDLRKAAVIAGNQQLIDQIDQLIAKYPELNKLQRENALANQVNGALNPNAQDIELIKQLHGLASNGKISKDAATAGVAGTSLRQSNTGLLNSLGQANPFGASGALGQQGALQGVEDERAQRLKLAHDSITDAQQLADATVAIEQDAAQKRLAIAQQFEDAKLALGEQTFQGLADGLGAMFGKQSAAYQAAFAVEKAFQVARALLALQTSIAQAAAIPWPANIPAIAAAISNMGSIMSALASVQPQGFATGVVDLMGPGTGTSDSIGARLSKGESVITAAATSKNKNTLMAMNAGATFDGKAANGNAPMVSPNNVKIINVLDPAIVGDYLATPAGESVIMNVLRRNGVTG